jgi:hypothetical protein
VKFANPRDDAALTHSSEPLQARSSATAARWKQGARQRDEQAERDDATEPFMRAPSKADAANAKDAGEFHRTPTYAASSAEGCAQREAQPRQRKNYFTTHCQSRTSGMSSP